jgi:hypothetical protein
MAHAAADDGSGGPSSRGSYRELGCGRWARVGPAWRHAALQSLASHIWSSTGRVRRTESIDASSSFGLAVELDVCARMLEMLADENRTPTVHLGGGGNARRQSGDPLNLSWMPSRTAAVTDSATSMPPGSATLLYRRRSLHIFAANETHYKAWTKRSAVLAGHFRILRGRHRAAR